jgi:hypothetical protein
VATKKSGKTSKQTVAKKGKTAPAKSAPKAAPRPAAAAAKPAPAAKRPAAASPSPAPRRPAAPAPRRGAQASLLERAERLREAIQASSHGNPELHVEARGWGDRAQQLVDEIARAGDTPAATHALEALTAEVEGDRDFQEAHRRA